MVTASTGKISTVAGNGTSGYAGDGGPATSAQLDVPAGVAIDASGNIYIADDGDNRVRKVAAGTGIITTVAGTGTSGYSGDNGPATSAQLDDPLAVAVDASGNVYISDWGNNRVRKLTVSTGIITTVAGTGAAGATGDNGPATSAKLWGPHGIAVDPSNNLYIADEMNGRIRKVTAATGIITTVAGTSKSGYSGDGGPATSAEIDEPVALAVDAAGNIYIADSLNVRLRKVTASTGVITTLAGNGTDGYSGDGGEATSAELNGLGGVAVDTASNLYIADCGNFRVRAIGSPLQTITFPNPGPQPYGATVSLMATASSGLAVTYSVTSGPATVSGSTLTIMGVGTIVVAANQAGNQNYNSAPQVSVSFSAAPASQTITFPNPGAQTYGVSPITLAATASSGLQVSHTVTSGPATVSGNTLTITGGGTVVLAANQAGNANYNAATQVSVSFTVNSESQTIAFPNPGAQTYGVAPITLTATDSSGLPVSYSVISGPATVSGNTLTITGAGTVVVAASQAGSANYSAATSTISFVVSAGSQSITFPNPGTQTYGVAPLTLAATASSGLPVSYSVTSGPATVSGNTLTITGAGSVNVAANQAGNSNYTAATGTIIFTVNPESQAITFPNPGTQTYGVVPITLTATASSGLPVTYTVTSGPATVSGNMLTILGAGTVVVAADQAGNANYGIASEITVGFTVNPPPPTSPASGTAGDLITITGSSFGTAAGTVTFAGSVAPAEIAFWTPTMIQAFVPTGVQTGPVVVSNANAQGVPTAMFTVAPLITSVSPSLGQVGTPVTLLGTGFGSTQGNSSVTFNGVAASIAAWSDTQVTATVPAGAGSGPVQIQAAAASNGASFVITNAAAGQQSAILRLRQGPVPSAVNLSDPINLDWITWGANGQTLVTTRMSDAIGGPQISDFTPLVATQTTSGNQGSLLLNWTNGTPIVSGNAVFAGAGTGTQNGGFQLTVPADTSYKTLTLYAAYSNSAELDVSISDGSNAPITLPLTSSAGYATIQQQVFLIDFSAATPGQSISIAWKSTTEYANGIILDAAVLTPHLPEVTMLSPQDGQEFVYPVSLPLGLDVIQFTSPVTTQVSGAGVPLSPIVSSPTDVPLQQGSGQVASQQISPFTWTWQPTPGHYKLQAQATDSAGLVTNSQPVEVDIIGTGGSLSAPLSTTTPIEVDLTGLGTGDWIIFAPRQTWNSWVPNPQQYSGVVRKANVAPLISPLQNTTITPALSGCTSSSSSAGISLGYSDGTPDTSESGLNCSVGVTSAYPAEFSVVADTTLRTLSVYVAEHCARGKLTAFLSDGSAPVAVNYLGNIQTTESFALRSRKGFHPDIRSGCSDNATGVFVIPYQAASAGQTLTVRWSLDASFDVDAMSFINIYAATLDGAGNATPVIASVTPTSALPGVPVTITGSLFQPLQGTGTVSFNGLMATILNWSDTSIVALVPPGAQTGPLVVTAAGNPSSPYNFVVPASPAIQPAGLALVAGSTSTLSLVDQTSGATVTGVNWNVDNSQIAAISTGNSPLVTAVAPGTANVSALWNGTTLTVAVNVIAAGVPVVQAPSTAPGTYASSATLTDSLGNNSALNFSYIGGTMQATSIVGSGCSTCTFRNSSQSGYDSWGHLVTYTDALGHVTFYTYDSAGNVTARSLQADGGLRATYSYTYNGFGEVMTATDPLDNTTTNTYDANGNLLSVTSPSPGGGVAPSATTFTYDGAGEPVSIIDPLGNITTIAYNSVGLVSSITDAQKNATTYQYDARGNRTSVTDALQHTTQFSYDSGNRLLSITYPDSTSASFTYDYRGRRISSTDQDSNTTQYAYDDADRLISTTDAASHTTQYAYDTEDNLLSITDANGNATAFAHDIYGRVTQATFPSTLVESYVYDALGHLTSKTDRKGQTITYIYDALNRMKQKTYPDSTSAEFVYDLVGKLQQVSDPTGTYGFAYDNMGRLVGTSTSYAFLPGQTFNNSYTYDSASNRTGYTAPDGSTDQYSYDNLNRLKGLANSWAGNFTMGYDALSRRTSLARPNGVNTSYQYDALSHLLSVLHSGANDGANYSYDPAGNRLSKQNLLNGVTENYGYDAVYQLQSVLQGTKSTESYTYDPVGNRLSALNYSNWTYNASNELTGNSASAFTYDNNGNMLSKSNANGANNYAWDFENRMTSATVTPAGGTASTVSFKYDPMGRRIWKSSALGTTIYLYDGANIVGEVGPAGVLVASYAQGSGIDQPLAMQRGGNIAYYQADGLGSITSLTNAAGNTVSSYVYKAFGSTTATEGIFNPFRYTGKERDTESGNDYFGARYYASSMGRFLSPDWSAKIMPVPYATMGDPQSLNLYAYMQNNPLGGADADGHCGLCWDLVMWAAQAIARDGGLKPFAGNVGRGLANGAARQGGVIAAGLAEKVVPGSIVRMSMNKTVQKAFQATSPANQTQADVAPVGAAIASTALTAGIGALASGEAAATTTLYRAVMPAEAESIESLGAFTNPAGIEVKYFSTTLEGAQSYASQATTAFGDGPFSFYSGEFPTSSITPDMTVTVDRGVESTVIPTEQLQQFTPPARVNP